MPINRQYQLNNYSDNNYNYIIYNIYTYYSIIILIINLIKLLVMAKITLSNGWCFEEAYDLNAMSHITGFSIAYGSDVFVNNHDVDWAAIESELFKMLGADILYGFNHRGGSNYIRIQAYTKHITELI